jgi:hypothetical protein
VHRAPRGNTLVFATKGCRMALTSEDYLANKHQPWLSQNKSFGLLLLATVRCSSFPFILCPDYMIMACPTRRDQWPGISHCCANWTTTDEFSSLFSLH